MSDLEGSESVVDKFFAAIEDGNLDDLRDIEADDICVWHNYTNVTQTKPENLATLGELISSTTERRYDDIERIIEKNIVAQRHTLVCKLQGSSDPICIPVAIFLTVKNDKIADIREYMNSAVLSV